MRTLTFFKTLVYYDGPEVFIGSDSLGTPHVCVLVENTETTCRYLCIAVSKGRLTLFQNGFEDLRSLFVEPEIDEFYLFDNDTGDYQNMALKPIPRSEVPDRWLPKEGFLLEPEDTPDTTVLQESKERQRAIIHCSLNPPESSVDHKITADHLGQALALFQRLVNRAYKKALQAIDDKQLQKDVGAPPNYGLEVYAFSPGSFTIHMQSAAPTDLFGYAQIDRALKIIDRINMQIEDVTNTVNVIADYGGHFAACYRDFFQFITLNEMPISYEWTMPSRNDSTKVRISALNAKPVYLALAARKDIGIEEKVFSGNVRKVDVDNLTWRLIIDDAEGEKRISGKGEAGKVDLSGIVIDAKYKFVCDERLDIEVGTGKERATLYLKSFYRLD